MSRRVLDAVGANLLLRVGSFALSMLLTRLSTPESRGMSFQADVVVNTVGFVAREALRGMYPQYRFAPSKGGEAWVGEMTRVLALAALAVPMAVIAMLALEVLSLFLPVPSVSRLEFVAEAAGGGSILSIPLACWLIGLAVEWACEPLVAITIVSHEFRLRVVTEALALTASKGAAVAAILLGSSLLSTVSPAYLVALQQLVYGVATAVVLFVSIFVLPARRAKEKEEKGKTGDGVASSDGLSLSEAQLLARQAAGSLSRPTIATVYAAVKVRHAEEGTHRLGESAQRLVLTEGEKFILSSYVAVSGQGVFDVVNTLGSLVARLVFRVWEDGSYAVWRGQIASVDAALDEERQAKGHSADAEGLRAAEARRARCIETECVPTLQSFVRICLYIGAVTLLLAQPLPRFALALVFSNRWAGDEATAVLRLFCAYIPLMGVNGLLEAFVRATARDAARSWGPRQQLMAATSVASVAVTLAAVRGLEGGVVGLMAASVLNVAGRTAVNLAYIRSYLPRAVALIMQPKAMGPLFATVAAVNAVLWASGGFEVGADVTVRNLTKAAVMGVAALVVVAPMAYRIERASPSSLMRR